jgi:hypothetical protein
MRPLYLLNRYKKVMFLFASKSIRFTRFQLRRIAIWPINGDDWSAFIWEKIDNPRPKVIAHINFVNLRLEGHAMMKSTNVAVAHLGPVAPANAELNGAIVGKQVSEMDPALEDLLNATVKKTAVGERPWLSATF